MAALETELARYLLPSGINRRAIHHPLLYVDNMDFSPESIAYANREYHLRRAQAADALRDRRYSDYVLAYEPPYRFEAMSRVLDRYMLNEERLSLLRATFTSVPAIWPNLSTWVKLFKPYRGLDAWNTLSGLPPKIEMWRGGRKIGIAWTSSEAKGKDYARNYRSQQCPLHMVKVETTELVASFAPKEFIWIPPRYNPAVTLPWNKYAD